MRTFHTLFVFVLFFGCAICRTADADDSAPPFLRVEADRFVDADGRQVILHGLNIISKSKDENYLSWHREKDFARMHGWGMNCVRLGIIWDGVEPEPGQYDDAYLDGVAQRIAWAEDHGLYVFLDMHQDLFSVLYSDGAPAWATLHEGKPHVKGAVWSDSYMISPAVQTAFDNFWANAPASDGVGIQDHYAAAWRHVAKRFADSPTVIGYDIMNEPFEGSSVARGQAALLQSPFAKMLAERLGGESTKSPEEVLALWLTPKGRQAIMTELEDVDLYQSFLDAQQPQSQAFETERLQSMHQRVADAIRTVDENHILLLETSYHCNSGVISGIEPVNNANGERDPLQAYAPHAYDIVVDTPSLADANAERVELILRRHNQTARRLNMPMLLGEWGAFGKAGPAIRPSARALQRQIESMRCGDTYWDFGRGIDRTAYFSSLKRSVPVRIAGGLLEYKTDPAAASFTCRWIESESVTAPTIVYVTAETFKNHSEFLSPKGAGFETRTASEETDDVYLIIRPTGESIERSLSFK